MIQYLHPLVLASGSAIRQQMLRSAGLDFSVEVSGVDEDAIKATFPRTMRPEEQALALARAKALAVSARHPAAVVIGVDQICALPSHHAAQDAEAGEGWRIFDKPETYAKAEAQLLALAGNTHQQHSGLVLARAGAVMWETVGSASLTLRSLTVPEIRAYLAAEAPLASCGAYHYEALGKHLFAAVAGNNDVIQGLPLQALISQLHVLGIIRMGDAACS